MSPSDANAFTLGKMNRPAVIQYWHREEPPEEIVELLATVPRSSPDLRQLVFDESSADAFIAEHFSRRHLDAFRACAQPAGQADYLRYCAAYVLGGICLDADFHCVGDLSSLLTLSERGTVFGRRDRLPPVLARFARFPYRVGSYWYLFNGIFAFRRAEDPLLELAIEVATANIEERAADGTAGVWLTTGDGVLTSIYLLHGLCEADSFLRYTDGTVLEPTASLLCEVAADRGALDRAMDGLGMEPFEEIDAWVKHIGIPRHTEGTRHWSQPDGSIFR